MKMKTTPNKLIHERSPYLLQHAYNPVHWYPWGNEALQKAKDEDKMLLISIGYAACHWCHVMEHECFEIQEVAQLMNEKFVCIKVDREERPDIDHVYISAVQAINGNAGWPLNCFALPDGRPFFGGTYFPKKQWLEVLQNIADIYQKNRQRIFDAATGIASSLDSFDLNLSDEKSDFTPEILQIGMEAWQKSFDETEGGNGHAPKFPMPNSYLFLLKYGFRTSNPIFIDHTFLTLSKMAEGGIYDQLGGGFSRYSVDKHWKVPHFEKMLYDNGQLLSLYSKAFQSSANEQYKKVVFETIDFLERELLSEDGAFFSSLDADSEGVEGKFYCWEYAEIQSALKDETTLFCEYYSVKTDGNWEETNILHITQSPETIAQTFQISLSELNERIEKCKSKLLNIRSSRIRPQLDDKIITSWNALTIIGLTHAFQAFKEPRFLNLALEAAHFLVQNRIKNRITYRTQRSEYEFVSGFLDDYAYTAEAFIQLYQATGDAQWLHVSKNLIDYTLIHFFDAETELFFYTSNLDEKLVARKVDLIDKEIPASNSVMAFNLVMLSKFYLNDKYDEIAQNMVLKVAPSFERNIAYLSNWARVYSFYCYPFYEIAVTGANAAAKAQSLSNNFVTNSLIAYSEMPNQKIPFLKDRHFFDDALIYVCEKFICQRPTKDVKEALQTILK